MHADKACVHAAPHVGFFKSGGSGGRRPRSRLHSRHLDGVVICEIAPQQIDYSLGTSVFCRMAYTFWEPEGMGDEQFMSECHLRWFHGVLVTCFVPRLLQSRLLVSS